MVLAGTIAAVPAGGISPAEAQSVPRNELVAGNFFGDSRDEQFWYIAGPTGDGLFSLSNGGVPGGQLTTNVVPYTVNGTNYDPFTGDFDGDGFDEIFWYNPGSGADFIWHFADSRHFRQEAVSVNGSYLPLAGDFNGDNNDDIMWYGRGSAPDSMWLNRRGALNPIKLAANVSGNYRPVVASIGKDATDDIVWYAPGTAADTVWDWTRLARTHTDFRITVNGSYLPVALDSFGDGPRGDDIWWYAPGAAADPFWDYQDGVVVSNTPLPLVSSFAMTVGDFFGDGMEDVDMINLPGRREVIRDFTFDGSDFVFFDYEGTIDIIPASADGRPDKGGRSPSAAQPHGNR
jgi:hypothetical protein